MIELHPEPLTADTFRPYGEVIDTRDVEPTPINGGLTARYHDLATVDVATGGGRALVNVFRTRPLPLPHRVTVMERHPLGSQAFMPIGAARFLVLVGLGDSRFDPGSVKLFVSDGHQGVNYSRNTWHHYQIVLGATADFLVIDRGGPGNNLEEARVGSLGITIPAVA
ncbi:MAG: ureidoglycolate lyase [Proteobacteria bacterium]|nr:MAG: ureidoglycolate lyase [Pseudomonadota bacterium]